MMLYRSLLWLAYFAAFFPCILGFLHNIQKFSSPEQSIWKTELHAISTGKHLSYESTLQALQKYHKINGNLCIPRRYKVPPTSEFPKEWHNLDLASTVYSMNWWSHNIASKPERVQELNKLDFVWERLQPEYNLVLEALITFKSMYGHVRVPATFIVPYKEEDRDLWPKATWAIPLGNIVYRIRSRGDFLRNDETAWSRRRQLDNLGFIWDVSDFSFRKFLTAIKYYKKLEGGGFTGNRSAIKVKTNFVVPSEKYLDYGEKNPWPEELRGYPLGAKCSAVRQKELYVKNRPERQRALQEIGFQKAGNAALGWLEMIHAAAIYSKMHNRVLDVPVNFVVPSPPSTRIDDSFYATSEEWVSATCHMCLIFFREKDKTQKLVCKNDSLGQSIYMVYL